MHVREMREQLISLQDQVANLEKQIQSIERDCNHNWNLPQRHIETIPGYKVPEEGCGSDFRPAVYVPERANILYTRVCLRCGKIETTTKTKPTGEVPVF